MVFLLSSAIATAALIASNKFFDFLNLLFKFLLFDFFIASSSNSSNLNKNYRSLSSSSLKSANIACAIILYKLLDPSLKS